MILTQAHAELWLAKQRMPRWMAIANAKGRVFKINIDACINAQVPGSRDIHRKQNDISNVIGLLQLVRKREPILPYLDKLALEPGTIINPQRRVAIAKRWAKRIRKNLTQTP